MKIAPSVLALLLVHGSAFAEPDDDVVVTDDAPKTCGPDLRRAPKSVRRAIQAWLDAQDDLDEADARAEDTRDKAAAKIAPDGDAPGSPDFAPPGTVEPSVGAQIDTGPAHATPRSSWLALDGLIGAGRGARVAIDLATSGHWVVGASGTIASDVIYNPNGFVENGPYSLSPIIDTVDARAMATLARDMGDGPWRLRASIGAGFVYTQATVTAIDQYNPMTLTGSGVFPVAEASIAVEHDIGASWGIEFGLLTTFYDQTLHIAPAAIDRGPSQTLLLGGLRHRL